MKKFNSEEAKILIVDDDIDNLNMLIDLLDKSNYHTYIATNGEIAVEQILHNKPDLVLLDVMMPGMDGFETCRCIKELENAKDIPVIFMTALSETVNKINGFEAGGADYITKPFDNDEVLARIHTQLTVLQLQKQLLEKNKQLADLNASKDKFFSIIAHDLKNPLAVFMSFSKILEKIDTIKPEELIKLVKQLQGSANNLYKLLENLLTWAKIQRGAIQFTPVDFDLNEVVLWNVKLLSQAALDKNITVNNMVDKNITLHADRNMINSAVQNILSNAIKFTRQGGIIEISTRQDKKHVELCIRDNGVGIPSKDIPNLFSIDSKVQTTGTADERGTGLGLILSREFINTHKGSILVESEEGAGTTMKIQLPCKQENL